MEGLNAGKQMERIFVQKDIQKESLNLLLKQAQEILIPMSFVPKERLNMLTSQKHQGVVAIVSPIDYYVLEQLLPLLFEQGKNPLFLILDQVTDIRNFGAIARTAECMGVNGLIIPIDGSAQVNNDAIQTSMGALNHLPVCRAKKLQDTIVFLKNSGIQVVACSEKGNHPISRIDFSSPSAIILGSEEKGIRAELITLADAHASISMQGKISSLNVSVSTGMVLYEIHKQRLNH